LREETKNAGIAAILAVSAALTVLFLFFDRATSLHTILAAVLAAVTVGLHAYVTLRGKTPKPTAEGAQHPDTELIKKIKETLEEILNEAKDASDNTSLILKRLNEEILDKIDEIGTVKDEIKQVKQAISNQGEALSQAVEKLENAALSVEGAVKDVKNAVSQVNEAAGKAKEAAENVKNASEELKRVAEKAGETLENLDDKVNEAVKELLGASQRLEALAESLPGRAAECVLAPVVVAEAGAREKIAAALLRSGVLDESTCRDAVEVLLESANRLLEGGEPARVRAALAALDAHTAQAIASMACPEAGGGAREALERACKLLDCDPKSDDAIREAVRRLEGSCKGEGGEDQG